MNCLHYCRFVHGHHHLEDVALFPALRRADPDIVPVVDRLEGEHRVVSEQLDEVEAAAAALGEDGRARVVTRSTRSRRRCARHRPFEEDRPAVLRIARAVLGGDEASAP